MANTNPTPISPFAANPHFVDELSLGTGDETVVGVHASVPVTSIAMQLQSIADDTVAHYERLVRKLAQEEGFTVHIVNDSI